MANDKKLIKKIQRAQKVKAPAAEPVQKSEGKDAGKRDIVFAAAPAASEILLEQGYEPLNKNEEGQGLEFIIKKLQGESKKGSIILPRLAVTEKPNNADNYAGLYKNKGKLIPDSYIKDIRVKDHLIAAILNARGNTMGMFGNFKADRFDIGLELEIKEEYKEIFTDQELIKIEARMSKIKRMLVTCGTEPEDMQDEEKMSLSDYLFVQTKNGLSFGRHGTDITYDEDGNFQYFRPIDIGTIKRAVRHGEYAKGVRESSIRLLEQISGDKIDINMEMLKRDQYEWIQEVDGVPRQAFSSEELLVQNLYPSTDVEHNDYPVTPMDNILSSITTHLSIESYRKLYFMNGKASKGILVFKSDEADQTVIDQVKQEYMASINSVENAFRTPIFGVGQEDDVEWISTSPQKKDGEFEFLYEEVSRNILAAFNMSPDELPGYTHLSRGTNQKTLSESNNEFKLTAARDTGLRPLILKWQDFFNRKLLPIMDKELSQIVELKLSGLDAQSRQEESLRLQQDQPIHMNMDEILEEVDKQKVGKHLGGEILFNEYHGLIVDKYIDVNKFMGEKLDDPAHYFNPILKYKRDAFWQQNLQLMMETNPNAVKAFYAEDPEFSFENYKMLIQEMIDEEMEDIDSINEEDKNDSV